MLKKLRHAIQNKRTRMLSASILLLHDNTWPHSSAHTQDIITSFGWDHHPPPPTHKALTWHQVTFTSSYTQRSSWLASGLMMMMWKMQCRSSKHHRQKHSMRVHKNSCPARISASIMVATMWKSILKYVESDNNTISYKNLLDFFKAKRYLDSEYTMYMFSLVKIIHFSALTTLNNL
jgi:hypothetical protein